MRLSRAEATDELSTVEEGPREATGPSIWTDGPAPNNAGGQESLVYEETETALEKETKRERLRFEQGRATVHHTTAE